MQDAANSFLGRTSVFAFLLISFFLPYKEGISGEIYRSNLQDFKVIKIADGLFFPWGLEFLPNGKFLVTERSGDLRIISQDGKVSRLVYGLPDVSVTGQGGLMDVSLHPDYLVNSLVYFSFVSGNNGRYGTEVVRGKLEGDQLTDTRVIFRAIPKFKGGRHFGSRLSFLSDQTLLVSLGDRGHRPNGQNLETHPGSVIRITDTGGTPEDNPFIHKDSTLPEIYTYGNRNVQGLFADKLSGQVWATEHGPQGGCELNLLRSGKNYGWADITFGKNYITGTKIGVGYYRTDVESPVYHWSPSNAPSGLTLYRGTKFTAWQGDLFLGSLKFRLLSRLELDGVKVVGEERLLEGEVGRIRTVKEGPEGFLYLLTDDKEGEILRLEPVS